MLENDGDLEDSLNQALASYSGVTIPEAFEARVLASVRRRVRQRRQWRWVGFGLVAAAAMVCLLFWPSTQRNRQTVSSGTPVATAALSPLPQIARRNLEVPWPQPVRFKRRSLKRPEPKLPQFPTPYPVTEEERALLRLARYKADGTTKAVHALGGPIKPIEIADLEIKPLATAENKER